MDSAPSTAASDAAIANDLRTAGTSLLCSASKQVRAIDLPFIAITPDLPAAGKILTAATSAHDNAAVHRAIHHSARGNFLIVDGGANRTRALFGDILAEFCLQQGICGVLVRGSVRDVAGIRSLRLPVWATSIHPEPAAKKESGTLGEPLNLNGAAAISGDWIVGDSDGVVVIRARDIAGILRAAHARATIEEDVRSAVRQGHSTCELFGIPT